MDENLMTSLNRGNPHVVHSPLFDDEILDFQQEFMSKIYNDITNKKQELIKQKLVEKGFGHLIDGIEKRRFPKVCCVKQDNWSYYFADDDTDEGVFIVAIEEYNIKKDLSIDREVNMTMTFNWQDTHCGEVTFAR